MPDPKTAAGPVALTALLSLRWPLALVAASAILAGAIGKLLQAPIKVQLVLDGPLPVNADVDVGRIKTPIRTTPIQTAPVHAKVTLPQGVTLAAPLAVQVPQLNRPLAVALDRPVRASVEGPVEARVSGTVGANVAGDVSADLRGKVDATVAGSVKADVNQPLSHRRIKVGLW